MQFCTSVLIGSAHEAKVLFGQLEAVDQERYKEFPIYKLYEQLFSTIVTV